MISDRRGSDGDLDGQGLRDGTGGRGTRRVECTISWRLSSYFAGFKIEKDEVGEG